MYGFLSTSDIGDRQPIMTVWKTFAQEKEREQMCIYICVCVYRSMFSYVIGYIDVAQPMQTIE